MGRGASYRLCIHWPRLGPYHLARLAGADAHARQRGAEVVALETARQDAAYDWDPELGDTPYRREVVFPEQVYENIDSATMHRGVTAALERIRPDAVAITSYSTPDARASLLWCKRHRRAAVLMSESKEDDADRIGWRERIKAAIIALFDGALVGGAPHQAYLEKLGFPSSYIFQGCDAVDNAFFAERTAQARQNPGAYRHLPGLEEKSPYFLASNRFIARKNLGRLIEAYGHYRKNSPNPWRLLLLGDGPERPALETDVRRLQIDGVVCCGFRQIDELPAYYAMAGAFIHPALIEPWGLVVNEAMASGLPVLVSDRSGCAYDLVRPGINGFLFDPTRIDELTRAMCVISEPQTDREAMGRASREIVAGWSPDRFGRQIWAAIDAAQDRVRRANRTGRMILWGVQRSSRRVHSFHSIED